MTVAFGPVDGQRQALVIRADANPAIGTGHVMRGIALAQAWQDGVGPVTLVARPGFSTGPLAQRVRSEGIDVVELDDLSLAAEVSSVVAIAQEAGAAWVVLDGYHLSGYQRILKEAGLRILAIDDNGELGEYDADLVLNQNLSADPADYERRSPAVRLLLGSRFVLLRREFRERTSFRRDVPPIASRVLVSFGGGDVGRWLDAAVAALSFAARHLALEVVIVVAGAEANAESARSAVLRCGLQASVVQNTAEMPKLMRWADVALSAAGSTTWEMCFMGLTGILVSVAANQDRIASALEDAGCFAAVHPDEFTTRPELVGERLLSVCRDQALRAYAARIGPELVDGLGACRVVAEMLA